MNSQQTNTNTGFRIGGVNIPAMLYGTAWKEDATAGLVRAAIEAGFRGIDTANQRRHYCEVAVGEALAKIINSGRVKRDELFLQTKFTYPHGQDHRLPYDLKASSADQVRQSLASSLEHLHTDYLDSFVLHGPSHKEGLSEEDYAVWETITEFAKAGKTRLIGICNVTYDQLVLLCKNVAMKPQIVQNRCFAITGWDYHVRGLCREEGIQYEGFSLLTANGRELSRPAFQELLVRTRLTAAQVVFAFARQMGMVVLTGTTDPVHMEEDLASSKTVLSEEDLELVERIAHP